MLATPEIAAAIQTTLDRYLTGYTQRNMALLLSAFAPDPDVTIWGTGKDELIVGRAAIQREIERDWSQSDEIHWEWEPIAASVAGNVAWIRTQGEIYARMGSIRIYMPTRITAVLELRDGTWLIQQMHLSVPAQGQTEGESFPPPT
jgi:hypothetical protein